MDKEILICLQDILKSLDKPEKVTMTIDECAKFSGIGKDKIIALTKMRNSDFPFFKVGTKTLINRGMFMEWLDRITEQRRVI